MISHFFVRIVGVCDSMIHRPFSFPKKGNKTPSFGRPFVCVDNRLILGYLVITILILIISMTQ